MFRQAKKPVVRDANTAGDANIAEETRRAVKPRPKKPNLRKSYPHFVYNIYNNVYRPKISLK
jgi:hypothetical protein